MPIFMHTFVVCRHGALISFICSKINRRQKNDGFCLYPALPRFVNCLYHCYIYHSLQTWLRFLSLSLNYPISSRSRTLLLVLSLKLLRPVISVLSQALSTGSESLNASNTSSSLAYKVFITAHPL